MRAIACLLISLSGLCYGSLAQADLLTFESLTAGECGGIVTPFTLGSWVFSRTTGDTTCVNSGTPTSNGLRFSWNGTKTLGFVDSPNPNGFLKISNVAG